MTTTPPTTEADAHAPFVNAIIAAPGCDIPRLVFADWLDERGESERAEFIRVQCEIATMERGEGEPTADTASEMDDKWEGWLSKKNCLREREKELWRILANDYDFLPVESRLYSPGIDYGKTSVAIVRRGFVAEVRAPLGVLIGEPCPRCHGEGSPYLGRDGHRMGRCPMCEQTEPSGTGRTPGIARAICQSQPVEEWIASDKEPDTGYGNNGRAIAWGWYVGESFVEVDPKHIIPGEIANVMVGGTGEVGHDFIYSSPQNAKDALNAALSKVITEKAHARRGGGVVIPVAPGATHHGTTLRHSGHP